MDNSFVEEVAASLVREFLSRKGLKKTISIMDQELPRSELSINNRNELRNVLHLQSLYKQNKAKENPLKTLLEIITNYFLERRGTSRSTTSNSALSASQSRSAPVFIDSLLIISLFLILFLLLYCRHDVENPPDKILQSRRHQHKSEKCHTGTMCNSHLTSDGDKKLKGSQEDLKSAVISEELQAMVKDKQRPRSGLIVRGMMAGPGASSPEVGQSPIQPGLIYFLTRSIISATGGADMTFFISNSFYVFSLLSVDVEDKVTTGEVSRNLNLSTLHMLQEASKAIDISLAKELKNLLFGSSLCCFSEEWKIQSFTFSNIPQLKYGIVQKKGGPCGVLAAVQACVLQQLIFGDSNRNKDARCLQPSEAHRTKCLTMAIADILWRAGGNEKAVVALPSGRQQFTPIGKYKADGILETVRLCPFLFQFEIGPCGCILLTVSVILSRSINLVRNDFDVLTNRLIGSHGYCTQELVNLLLTGKAVSNVFNDVIELNSGNGNITILKGITSRSDIGLLSLFEHYDVCQVGCYLKTPKYPIWLVCSESHFSVLFCLEKDLQGDWKTERRFDLYYYDGLANQEEEIRLTVDTTQMCTEDKENDLTPPLEHCIRTKWQGAVIDWNGTEPIL
uniref:Ubiquitin carboxyl-terminal hydrolase MINDY n=1 Tax=Coturnix japonica TaxID=93934 RepID=A0A8C2TE94_COTJA